MYLCLDYQDSTYKTRSSKIGSSSKTSVVVISSVVNLLGFGQEVTEIIIHIDRKPYQINYHQRMSAIPPLQTCFLASILSWYRTLKSPFRICSTLSLHCTHTRLFPCVWEDISHSTPASDCASHQGWGGQHSETLGSGRNWYNMLTQKQVTFALIWQCLHRPFLVSLAGSLKSGVERTILPLEILAKYFTLIARSRSIIHYSVWMSLL